MPTPPQNGDSCLHAAVAVSASAIVTLLLSSGVSPFVKNKVCVPQQPPHLSPFLIKDQHHISLLPPSLSLFHQAGLTPLHTASFNGDTEMLIALTAALPDEDEGKVLGLYFLLSVLLCLSLSLSLSLSISYHPSHTHPPLTVCHPQPMSLLCGWKLSVKSDSLARCRCRSNFYRSTG